MVGFVDSFLSNLSVFNIGSASNSLLEKTKETLASLESEEDSSSSPLGEDDIISEQTDAFLNGEGGVSGFTEANFEDKSFTSFQIVSPSLIENPSEVNVVDINTDTSILSDITDLREAQVKFEAAVSTVDRANEEQNGRVLDLLDVEDE